MAGQAEKGQQQLPSPWLLEPDDESVAGGQQDQQQQQRDQQDQQQQGRRRRRQQLVDGSSGTALGSPKQEAPPAKRRAGQPTAAPQVSQCLSELLAATAPVLGQGESQGSSQVLGGLGLPAAEDMAVDPAPQAAAQAVKDAEIIIPEPLNHLLHGDLGARGMDVGPAPAALLPGQSREPFHDLLAREAVALGCSEPSTPCLPGRFPSLAPQVFTVGAPEDAEPDEVAAQLAASLSRVSHIFYAPPHAAGCVVTCVEVSCPPTLVGPALALAPAAARRGWSSNLSAARHAQLSDHHSAVAVVVLGRGQAWEEQAACGGDHTLAAEAFRPLLRELEQLVPEQGLLGLLAVADAVACVLRMPSMLPMLDEEWRCPLGLFALQLVAESVRRDPAPPLPLPRCSAAAAWKWFCEHAAPRLGASVPPSAAHHLRSLLPGDSERVCGIATGAPLLTLDPAAPLPVVLGGAADHFPLAPGAYPGLGSMLVALVPVKEATSAGTVPAASLQAALADDHSCFSLHSGPLVVGSRVANRSDVQLYRLCCEGSSEPGERQRVLELLNQVAAEERGAGCFVDLTEFMEGVCSPSGGQLATRALDAMAAAVRRGIKQRSAAGAQQSIGSVDLTQLEMQFASTGPLAAKAIDPATYCASMQPLLDHLQQSLEKLDSGGEEDELLEQPKVPQGLASRLDKESDRAAFSGLLELEQQVRTAAGPPDPSSPPGSGTIHVILRASSTEGPGIRGDKLGTMAACAGANMAVIFAPTAKLPGVKLYLEYCSVEKHSIFDRVTIARLIAALKPGDMVWLPSVDRGVRHGWELPSLCSLCRARGASVVAGAVGPHSPCPAILLEDAGQLDQLPRQQREEVLAVVAETVQLVRRQLDRSARQLAAQQGFYTQQHALMGRVLSVMSSRSSSGVAAASGSSNGTALVAAAAELPAQLTGAVGQLMHRLTQHRHVVRFSRTSVAEELGDAGAHAGAADGRKLASASLQRQDAFLALHTSPEAASQRTEQHNGVSVCSSSKQRHPLLVGFESKRLLRVVVLATSVDRLSRAPGQLERLRQAAQQAGSDVVLLLQGSEVLDAMKPHYTASGLGERYCQGIPAELLEAVDAQVGQDHAMVSPAAARRPVVAAVSLVHCSAAVFAALAREERTAAGFASGFDSSFSGGVFAPAAPARDAGIAACAQPLKGVPKGARGLCSEVEAAAVAGFTGAVMAVQQGRHASSAAAWQDGSQGAAGTAAAQPLPQPPRPAPAPPADTLQPDVASSLCSKAAWRCHTCSCGTGLPDLHCRCDCIVCHTARESLCPCSRHRAAHPGSSCTCLPSNPCTCKGCHVRQGADRGEEQLRTAAAAGAAAAGEGGVRLEGQPAAGAASGAGEGGPAAAAGAHAPRRVCAAPGCQKPATRTRYCGPACYEAHCSGQPGGLRRCAKGAECQDAAGGEGAVLPPGSATGVLCGRCKRLEKRQQQQGAGAVVERRATAFVWDLRALQALANAVEQQWDQGLSWIKIQPLLGSGAPQPSAVGRKWGDLLKKVEAAGEKATSITLVSGQKNGKQVTVDGALLQQIRRLAEKAAEEKKAAQQEKVPAKKKKKAAKEKK